MVPGCIAKPVMDMGVTCECEVARVQVLYVAK